MQLYTISLSQNEEYLIYRPLLSLAFVGNRAMADLCTRLSTSPITDHEESESRAYRFLQSVHFFDPDPPIPPSAPIAFQPTLAVLLMTNRCQLRCVYCYADAGEVAAMDLTEDMGRIVIDAVFQNAVAQNAAYFEVSFHGGGEPSLAWDTLKACADYARAKPIPARLTLTSNGVWSETQCQWIIGHLDGVSLSMDGRAQTQNHQRPFHSGAGSFDRVWRNIQRMDAHGFDYAIRLTAAEPWEDFPSEIAFLSRETGCKKFHVEPTFHIERGTHGDPLPGDGQGFVDAFLEAADIAEAAGCSLTYSGGRLGLVTDTFCAAPYQAMIVNPLGQFVTCYELAGRDHPMNTISVIGSLGDEGVQVDEHQRNILHQLIAARRSACRDCFCYWSCAGDCYVRAMADPDADVHVRGERCEINRQITLGLILKQVAKGRGVWYAPRNAVSKPHRIIIQKEPHGLIK